MFSDQAVIAIENARLFQELDQRNRELGEALEHQTATAEVLRAITGSLTDVQPVLDAIASSALRLSRSAAVELGLVDGDVIRHVARAGAASHEVGSTMDLSLHR